MIANSDNEPKNSADKTTPLRAVASQNSTKPRKGIYLLPNLFTTGSLFFGFYAIVSAMNGQFEYAAIAIFVAMVLDGLDGRVARLTNTQSEFGAEYDSLSDMVAFGVAPALVAFSWSSSDLGKIGWMATFIYVAAAALRLARFNVQIEIADKRYFAGLPSPSAAAVLAGLVWVGYDMKINGAAMAWFMSFMTVVIGGLMVSNFRYYSFKDLTLKDRVPFVALLVIVLGFAIVFVDPPRILLGGFLVYAFSGPVLYFLTLRKWRNRRA